MEKYSCWNFPYSKRYYLTHPWKWFKDLGRNIADAHMRIRYGFCWSDVWNWDHWFMHTTPQMLRHMADHGSAYPGHPPFENPDDWHDWLHHIADLIESGSEDWQDEHNEYHEEYMEHIMEHWNTWTDADGNVHRKPREQSELDKKYFARSKELAEQGEINVQEALSEIGKHFYDCWD